MISVDFNLLPGIALALDLQGGIVHSNDACARLIGRPAEDLYQRPLWQLMAEPQDAACIREMLEAAHAGVPLKTFECSWAQSPGGERQTFAVSGVLAPGTDTRAPLLMLTGIDITELVSRREEDSERLRALLEQAPDAVVIANLEGRLTDVNDAAIRLLGYTRHEIIGMSIVDFIPEEDVERLWRGRERVLAGAVAVADWRLRKKDGSQVLVEVSSKILPDGRWQAVARDISERANNERVLRESLAAKRAVAARDEVLAIVAHELRAPVNVGLLHCEILRRRTDQTERSLNAIRRASQRMKRLIGDMLDVTALEAGSLTIKRSKVLVESLLSEAVDTQWDNAADARLWLRMDAAGRLPDLLADRDRLLQVFDNLIGNAIKFTPPGGHVVVGAVPRATDVLFCVSDTGPGIPHKKLGHVFDRFWQVNKNDSRGVGLGLPIAKGIVEAHGGWIWVQSEPREGATFFFTVPLQVAT